MAIESSSRQSSLSSTSGQDVTKEQLQDVYAAGTSDGKVMLDNEVVTIPNEGYEDND
ncbi:hypothetical protein ACFQ88_17135 [Paenibacillus sp. NPDC056579]|uniref:hypothetical protein n=1 Tax=Bacillati TaxID=1783272 RepID=UPI001EF75BF1|nr:hypothetical protein [Paenibacillus sp. H1-7]